MQIQVNSDNHIESSIRLENWVRSTLESTLERYDDYITRVEVHLRDENGDKAGPNDIRCQMEARPKGHQPISVTHKADTLDLAVDGAASKLDHALEHLIGKLRDKQRHAQTTAPFDPENADALLQEEFLENEQAKEAERLS
ncbi:HPF/RaiA family ribosome-associated protein [Pseudomonas sp. DTU_2021_1001937_2_SI_NGA_ILE_001]|uniref:HPF/RaiA family ribosome-associated protein n=1 Tax=Pseudomonas sp. DTU_2021_1001937_2_SI_NGA_ILE_001 TaxID=3077589 RepID=UPI0025F13A15|nr:HPF/RaiA family ribosome-associated protein [Pseudomonas sp. DTU_2021_1001937_2_SI_NGA_ILE_001]WNW13516.1 HPF/RaiA family ribosome-associated protein [Pseudomonas sp. DTU_2021_1001937_2_SI_NGA_ILE_001]